MKPSVGIAAIKYFTMEKSIKMSTALSAECRIASIAQRNQTGSQITQPLKTYG
jgi:hypothetical protein